MQTSFIDLVGSAPADGFLAVACDELTNLTPVLDTANVNHGMAHLASEVHTLGGTCGTAG
ncbi:MAG: hypothetical protein ACKVH7_02060 [Alphaproteobacteria bacterium]|jgi:hypothetical protein